MSNLDDPDDEVLLDRLAAHDNRKLLLWQLAADGRTFCGIRFVARERGLQDAPPEAWVAAFVDDMLTDEGEIRAEYDESTDWEALESQYGDTVDHYIED